jgi:hypothetical protein
LVELKIPDKYPNKQPEILFVTPIYHGNIDTSGVPCPALVYGSGWTPSNTLRGLLLQLVNVLNDPDPDSSIRPELCALLSADPAAYNANAAAFTAEKAVGTQTFSEKKPGVPPVWSAGDTDPTPISELFLKRRAQDYADKQKKKGGGAAQAPWPHDYLLMEGEFANEADGSEVVLPRLKFVFRELPVAAAAGAADAGASPLAEAKLAKIGAILGDEFLGDAETVAAAAATVVASDEDLSIVPLDAELEAKVMALELTFDDEPLTIKGCYKLQPSRQARYAAMTDGAGVTLFPSLAEPGAVAIAVQCVDGYDETIETILDAKLEHCVAEDPIMMSEATLPSIVEAQFELGGPWTSGAAPADTLAGEKENLFKIYETFMTQENPECLSALRRMLQAAPVGTAFARGRGFSLRMPEADLASFETVNEQGKVTQLPRPSIAVRVWDAEARQYTLVDNQLAGGPSTPEAAVAWYRGVVKILKGSPYLGPDNVDKLVTSTKHEWDGTTFHYPDAGSFSNEWTDIVLATTL